ncbi:hypothetical protein BKA69DRAFT_500885 [Paraphysoderma sedebokerense]|nr:hypothetical protein BKA69DRAFT_500885 [Paraphysoderma sedebokerense]
MSSAWLLSELSILNVFKDSLQLWSDFNFVRYSTYELIRHVSSLFLLTLSFLTPTEICNLRLTTAMLPGVQRYLESSIQDVRKLGMIVAECVSEKVASCEAGKADVKLDFGLVGTDVDVLKKFAIWSNDIFETERNQGKEVECTGSQFGGHSENIEIRAIPEPINQSTLRKDIAFHSDPSASPYLSPNTQKPHLLSNVMDSDDESEEEENFQPYALPKEADRTDEAVPKNIHQRHRYFLRDILNFLKASEDPERIRLGLEYCSQVVAIESSAKRDNVLNMGTGELNELAIDVVGALLRLENQFHQGEDDNDEGESFDFERRRTEALVSFCCCVNVEVRNRVVEFIGSQFWEPNYNINQRLNMLNILSVSVKQLSDLPSPPSLPTSLTSSSPAATVSSISSAIQASPKQPTTTRRSTKLSQSYIQKQQQTQPVESKLTESAKTFFYPLISRMDYSFSSVLGKREKNVIELVRTKETSLLSSAVEGISLSGQNLEYTNIGLQSGKLDLNVCKPDDGKSGVAEERKATGGLATEGLVLLESLIRSLGIIIYYSAHVPSVSTLARSYWQYLYSLRYHQHSKIQASLVFGFSVIFDIRDGKNLVEDYGEEVANVGAWVNEILQLNQVDKNLYVTSSQLLFQISEAIENYRKAFFGVS